MARSLDFSDGFTSVGAPTSSALSTVTGTYASPVAVTAGAGITPGGYPSEIKFIQGSGGAVDITVNPQIAAGTNVGDQLRLIGCSDTNTVKLDHGTGLTLNGSHTLGLDESIDLTWNGTSWSETARREN